MPGHARSIMIAPASLILHPRSLLSLAESEAVVDERVDDGPVRT
jgi:hypothetical protein